MTIRKSTRRRFLEATATTGAAFGLAELSFLHRLQPVSAAEAKLDPKRVQFGEDIEPTVRFHEDTPTNRIIEEILAQANKDLTYRELMAALLLAGIRNIPGAELASHRNVGGELHSIFVINSAHLTSLSSPENERWWPLLWAVDAFKVSQSRPVRNGRRRPKWEMPPIDESAVPRKSKARQAFIDAVENWDEDAADPAAVALARAAKPDEIFELLWQYGPRDYRYIGHKAIFLANAWRTLQLCGFHHIEPVLRGMARALTAYFHDQGHPNKTDQLADRSWKHNQKLAASIRTGWQTGKNDPAATEDLLSILRQDNPAQAAEAAVELLNRQISPQVIWDAVLTGVAELLMTWPGFDMVHAVTTTNAIHFAYRRTTNDETRKRLMLQAAAFVPLFRDDLGKGTRLQNVKQLNWLTPRPLDNNDQPPLDDVFSNVNGDPRAAAEKTLTYLQHHKDPKPFIDQARRFIFLKGQNHHDYKYSAAVLEDVNAMSPDYRNRFLAGAMFQLLGADAPDSPLAQRIKAST